MKLSVIVPDNVIIIDGVLRRPVGFMYPDGIRAVQWDGTEGQIECTQGSQKCITDAALLADYVAAHAAAPENESGPTAPPATPAEAALAQIRSLEAPFEDDIKKIQRQFLIAALLKEACALPAAAGMTEAQVHAILMTQPDKAYARLVALEALIVPLRELLP